MLEDETLKMLNLRKHGCSKLLAIVIYITLYDRVVAVKQLDMAPDAVDDLYTGCRNKAIERFILSGLLEQELSRNEGFKASWNSECSTQIPAGLKQHTAALLAYVKGDPQFKKSFNEAVETMGFNMSTYQDRFHFKALHFLLMDSISLLTPKACKNVYRVSSVKYTAQKGSKVRFGRFTSVQSDVSLMEDVDEGTFFNITTCFFANLENFCNIADDVALLSPTEEFTVEDVIDRKDYTEIILKHSNLKASHDCYVFSRSPADAATNWPLLVLVALSICSFIS